MIELIDSYFKYLSNHPTMLNSIGLWTVSMTMVYIILFKYRERMIAGMSGANNLWDSPEIIGYIVCWIFPPVLFYSAFFNVELPSWVWYFTAFCVAYTLGGKWLLEWVLAFKAGATKVDTDTETKQT
jgi:hypothetical protein